jgi:hypothetical protein
MKKSIVFLIFLIAQGVFAQLSDFNITGPVRHKNLSVFFIHGKSRSVTGAILTLKEAIEQRKIIIHETGEVNELKVENISDGYIFIQEGDIVKGGRQDRVLQYDMVVAPRSGRIPISSFCVESGRWSGRGKEDAQQFGSSNNRVASKKIRITAKESGSQQEVWNEVGTVQSRLSSNIGGKVASPVSESSLQLTLENKNVVKASKEYIDGINKGLKDGDVVGYVFAINGEINSADIYADSKLFRKMWPKLLEASAIEAISKLDDESENKGEITVRQVCKWFDEVEAGKASKMSPNENTEFKVKTTDKNMMYETYIKGSEKEWIHKIMIKK